jgi:hypothetical protein
MPLIRPRDVVAEINELGRLYLIPDGPSTIPLNETTIPKIRRILKLIQQIPPDLRPKDSNYRLLNEAVRVSQEALQNAEREQSQASLLYGKPEHEHENPLSIIRRMLSWTPSLRPKEVRRRLLELAAENEKTSPSGTYYADYLATSQMKNVLLDEIHRHMRICRDDGFVTLDENEYGPCSMRLTSNGWKFLEESSENTDVDNGLIFISCGRFTDEEKALGHALADAVDELTPYQGFVAQNESSFEGLAKNIFGALRDCVGLVAVMHHRGTVNTPHGGHVRGSVWIEQEIAITAFLTEVEGREIPVLLYLQDGISREGLRQQLHLNPMKFTSNEEVVADFRRRVQDFLVPRGSASLS